MSQLFKSKTTGKIYRQICISNATATKRNWETTMVYQDVKSGAIWSRRLNNFLEANEQIIEPPKQSTDKGGDS